MKPITYVFGVQEIVREPRTIQERSEAAKIDERMSLFFYILIGIGVGALSRTAM